MTTSGHVLTSNRAYNIDNRVVRGIAAVGAVYPETLIIYTSSFHLRGTVGSNPDRPFCCTVQMIQDVIQ